MAASLATWKKALLAGLILTIFLGGAGFLERELGDNPFLYPFLVPGIILTGIVWFTVPIPWSQGHCHAPTAWTLEILFTFLVYFLLSYTYLAIRNRLTRSR